MRRLVILLLVLVLAACASPTSAPVPPSAQPAQLTGPTGRLATGKLTPPPAAVPVTRAATDLPAPALTSTAVAPTQAPPTPEPATPTGGPPPIPSGFPDPNMVTWRPVVGGLQKPIGLAHAGDGSGRLFVLEQPGRIRIIQNGLLLPGDFLDITDRVGDQGSERGLLGLAFHPQYASNGYFYVNYTDLNGDTVIARFKVSAGNPFQADPASEKRLLFVRQPYPNHNGGEMSFGPDGYLYLGLGDGGSQGDPQGNAQSLNTLLGKILRLDVDSGEPYAIPLDNPLANGGGKPEIWAYGLRNPWRFSFDRLTGDLYIGDVGQDKWEEIDFLPRETGGANFGWNLYEGLHPYRQGVPAGALVTPVVEYGHEFGCAVIGGVVYRGQELPAWQGIYLYGDYCTGNLWGLYLDAAGNWQSQLLFNSLGAITSIGDGESGEVYIALHDGGVFLLEAK